MRVIYICESCGIQHERANIYRPPVRTCGSDPCIHDSCTGEMCVSCEDEHDDEIEEG